MSPFFSGRLDLSEGSPPSDFDDSEELSTSPANVCQRSKFRIKAYIIIHNLIQFLYNKILQAHKMVNFDDLLWKITKI